MLRILEPDRRSPNGLKAVSLTEQRKRVSAKGSTEHVGVDPKTNLNTLKNRAQGAIPSKKEK